MDAVQVFAATLCVAMGEATGDVESMQSIADKFSTVVAAVKNLEGHVAAWLGVVSVQACADSQYEAGLTSALDGGFYQQRPSNSYRIAGLPSAMHGSSRWKGVFVTQRGWSPKILKRGRRKRLT